MMIQVQVVTITGTDIYGNVQVKLFNQQQHIIKLHKQLSIWDSNDITVDAAVAADVTVGIADAIANQSALITIKSGSDVIRLLQ